MPFVPPPFSAHGLPLTLFCPLIGDYGADITRDPPAAATVLQMRPPVVLLSVFKVAAKKEYLSARVQVYTPGPQSVRRIYDSDGNHCGLWWTRADTNGLEMV